MMILNDFLFNVREGQFDEDELSDLLSRIIEISKEVVQVANRAAQACPNRLPKEVIPFTLKTNFSIT